MLKVPMTVIICIIVGILAGLFTKNGMEYLGVIVVYLAGMAAGIIDTTLRHKEAAGKKE
jgi:F0F1-type ATP synthase assembly protein I